MSANPSLFQNSNYSVGESTADYLYGGFGAQKVPIEDMLSDLGLSEGQIDQLMRVFKDAKARSFPDGENGNGVLLQIFVPNAIVDKVAYPSLDMGKLIPGLEGAKISELFPLIRSSDTAMVRQVAERATVIQALDKSIQEAGGGPVGLSPDLLELIPKSLSVDGYREFKDKFGEKLDFESNPPTVKDGKTFTASDLSAMKDEISTLIADTLQARLRTHELNLYANQIDINAYSKLDSDPNALADLDEAIADILSAP